MGMLLQVLQDTANATLSFPRAAAEQIPGVLFGACLGFFFAVLLHRRQAREAKASAARDLTSQAKFALRRLTTRVQHLDEARNEDHSALVAYCQLYKSVWDGSEAAFFRGAIQSATILNLTSLNAWRESVAALESAQSSHRRILSLTVLPGQPTLDTRAATYRQTLVDAKTRLHAALSATRRYADRECTGVIDQLLQE